jgi:serine protease Do
MSAALAGVVLLLTATLLAATAVASEQTATIESATEAHNPPAGLSDLKTLERQIQATVDKVSPAVVGVSGGSGVVVSQDGYVLTVAHVGARAGRDVTIVFPDGREAKGKTLGNDRGMDAGLVKITERGPWPHAEMGRSEDLKVGQWCVTLGYPISFERGKPPIVRVGRVLRNRSPMIVTDCPIMGGDSGGPLIDLQGRVIGIGSRCDNTLTMNIHVPIDRFHDHWDQLVQGKDFDSRFANVAFLGVGPDETTDEARIGYVISETAAEKAGIKAGDTVLKIDGNQLQSYDELPPLIWKRKPGDEVEIEILRGEQTLKLKATLGRHPG